MTSSALETARRLLANSAGGGSSAGSTSKPAAPAAPAARTRPSAPVRPAVPADRVPTTVTADVATGPATTPAPAVDRAPTAAPTPTAAPAAAAPAAARAASPAAAPARRQGLDAHPEVMRAVEQLDFLEGAIAAAGVPNPYFQQHLGVNGATVAMAIDERGPSEYVNFSSYNYLGLAGHPAVVEAVQEAVARYGSSASASRMVSGELPLHQQLEARIAEAYGTGGAIAVGSGYLTNLALVAYVLGPNDVAVCDSLVHSSILGGTQWAGCRRLNFRHNDPDALDTLLRRTRSHFEQAMVIVEGVYSMDGDICRLPELIEVARRHNCLVMVDEAHSFGVLGEHGFGAREHFGLRGDDVDLWMGTLSKSLASYGGFVAASADVVRALKFAAPGLSMFAAGPPPATMAAAVAAFDLLAAEPERVARLQSNSALFLDALRNLGLDTGDSEGTAIVPVLLRGSERSVRVSVGLLAAGINANPILYPAVAEDEARIRFFLSSEHTPDQLWATARLLAEVTAAT